MKLSINCLDASPLTEWVQVLVKDGWKVIDHEAEQVTAKRKLGQSEYPLKNATVWYITLEELDDSVTTLRISVDAPSFAVSTFSRARIYEEFEDIAADVGACTTDEDLEVNLLENLRNE